MKKIILLLLVMTCLIQISKAQLFADFFQQKKAEKKNLVLQIAALEVFMADLKKGYNAAQKGLTTIGDIKNGDLGQHTDYFNSLGSINPSVAKYSKVNDIMAIQKEIQAVCAQTLQTASKAGVFTATEIAYIHDVFERLNADCLNTLQGLQDVTTAGKLKMKDDERIKRIDQLYGETQSQYGFAQSYGNSIKLMAIQKTKEGSDIKTMDSWYGIKN
jgi:hypothetical protein